jgi:hypothetical protein
MDQSKRCGTYSNKASDTKHKTDHCRSGPIGWATETAFETKPTATETISRHGGKTERDAAELLFPFCGFVSRASAKDTATKDYVPRYTKVYKGVGRLVEEATPEQTYEGLKA